MRRAGRGRYAAGLVRAWVRLYTAGLPADLRDARREEVDADLWEQLSEEDAGPRVTLAVWFRWLFGVHDDLTWRLAHMGTACAQRKEGAMLQAQGDRTATIVVAVLAAVFLLGLVAYQIVDNIQYYRQVDFALVPDWEYVLAITAPTAVGSIVGGFWLMRRAPMLGAVLAASGSIAVGIMFFWLIVPLLLGAGMAWYAFRRARRLQAGR